MCNVHMPLVKRTLVFCPGLVVLYFKHATKTYTLKMQLKLLKYFQKKLAIASLQICEWRVESTKIQKFKPLLFPIQNDAYCSDSVF